MGVWFTSDLHIGHAAVAAMRFPDIIPECQVQHHDATLAFNWDAMLGKSDDQVWVLGDISAGGRAAQLKALEWIGQRPGMKHLIVGNHDGCHPMYRDSHKWQRLYLAVFESVQLAARRNIPLGPSLKQEVLLSHYPYEGDHKPADRHTQWRLRDEGMPILHGHVHSSERVTVSGHRHPDRRAGADGCYAAATQIHVGVDAWDFRPVRLDEIAELILARRA